MENETNYTAEFTSQSETYTKFLIYHVVIVFTIVFSLLKGVNNINSSDIEEKVTEARKQEAISGRRSTDLIKDDLLSKMYFDDSTAITPPLDQEAVNSVDTATTVTPEQQKAALEKQLAILNELQNIYASAFIVKLTFLGDVQVDLRTWIFLLPIIFLLSLVYVFILDYKIALIKKQASIAQYHIPLNKQFPFNFLRPIFLFIELLLITIYTYILFIFLQYSENFRDIVLHAYFFMVYYGTLYCYFVLIRLNDNCDVKLHSHVYSLLLRLTKNTYRFLLKFNPFIFLRTGQVLMFCTLFLIMTYSRCNESGKPISVKGYQLIITAQQWESEWSTFAPYFYKFLYILIIVLTFMLLFLFSKKTAIKHPRLLGLPSRFFVIIVFLYSIYFSLFNLWFDDWNLVLSLLFLLWYHFFRNKYFGSGKFDKNHFLFYVVFLFPHIVYSFINIIGNNKYDNGWIYFYSALWIMLSALVLISDRIYKSEQDAIAISAVDIPKA